MFSSSIGYLKYNITAKLLYRRLLALGASSLVPLGLGDDQHRSGYDAALDAWLPQLWTSLRSKFPLPVGVPLDSEPAPTDVSAQLHSKYRIALLPRPPEDAPVYDTPYEESVAAAAAIEALDAAASGLPAPSVSGPVASAPAAGKYYSAAAPFSSTLTLNSRVTADSHFQDVRLLEFSLEGSGIGFDPGDIIGIWPQQREDSVAAICLRCGLDPGACVSIESISTTTSTDQSSTNSISNGDSTSAISNLNGTTNSISDRGVVVRIGALIAGVLDISAAIPRRVFFQALAQHCPPGPHADRLAHFASPAGRDDCHEYTRREGRTVLEILSDFPTATLSLDWLLSYCPRLRPRKFSVASSLTFHPAKAQLLMAVVEWTTPGRRRRRGLCSTWLAGLAAGSKVALWVERGALHMPSDPSVPLILVGPGTGVAPFRAFLQDRLATVKGIKEQGNGEMAPAPCTLVFGCRNEHGDYYCWQEWEEMQREGVLDGPGKGLLTAFSRDSARKVYVQHRIKEHGAEIWGLLQQGAIVYVAGSADKMPSDVEAAFKAVVAEHSGLAPAEAERYVKRLEATGKYQVECWS